MSTLPGLGGRTSDDPLSVVRSSRPPSPARRSRRSRTTADALTEFRISMSVVAGVPVVALEGHLAPDCLRDCSDTFAAAVRLRPRWIVADLSRAVVDEQSVPVLGLMRRFAGRHGVKLALAAVPTRGLDVLRLAEVSPRYDVHTTVPLAMAAATTRAHRSFPRS